MARKTMDKLLLFTGFSIFLKWHLRGYYLFIIKFSENAHVNYSKEHTL